MWIRDCVSILWFLSVLFYRRARRKCIGAIYGPDSLIRAVILAQCFNTKNFLIVTKCCDATKSLNVSVWSLSPPCGWRPIRSLVAAVALKFAAVKFPSKLYSIDFYFIWVYFIVFDSISIQICVVTFDMFFSRLHDEGFCSRLVKIHLQT